MERGLSIAASGMLAEQIRQDQLANDLANGSTPGYKTTETAQRSFGDLLVTSGNEIVGHLPSGTQVAQVRTSLEQGALQETGEPLDVAIQGDGFLAVQTPQGVRYTRNGQLRSDAGGGLVTQSGYAVLDAAGQPIKLAGTTGIQIAGDGQITVAGKAGAKIAIVGLTNPTRIGDTLFQGTAGPAPQNATLKQGFLESSAVNAARSMVDMIVSMRAFEAAQRVIHAIDDSLGRGINAAGGG
jgi:flagellar basal-body rod protein FlgG